MVNDDEANTCDVKIRKNLEEKKLKTLIWFICVRRLSNKNFFLQNFLKKFQFYCHTCFTYFFEFYKSKNWIWTLHTICTIELAIIIMIYMNEWHTQRSLIFDIFYLLLLFWKILSILKLHNSTDWWNDTHWWNEIDFKRKKHTRNIMGRNSPSRLMFGRFLFCFKIQKTNSFLFWINFHHSTTVAMECHWENTQTHTHTNNDQWQIWWREKRGRHFFQFCNVFFQWNFSFNLIIWPFTQVTFDEWNCMNPSLLSTTTTVNEENIRFFFQP